MVVVVWGSQLPLAVTPGPEGEVVALLPLTLDVPNEVALGADMYIIRCGASLRVTSSSNSPVCPSVANAEWFSSIQLFTKIMEPSNC